MARRPSIHAADVLAWALYQTGDYTEAKAASQQALRLGTRDALMLYHAGMIALKLGETAQAEAYLSQALVLNPHFSLRYADQARQTLAELRAAK
jgi:Tfp pilus assembly protein PilF